MRSVYLRLLDSDSALSALTALPRQLFSIRLEVFIRLDT